MTWYCSNCQYMNGSNDLYCCHCYQIRNSSASEDGGLQSIAPATGPLLAVKFGYNTHDDDNHKHYKASFSNCLDLDSASIDTTSVSQQDPHDGKWRKFWHCCHCGDGPLGCGNIPACPICQHIQCANCETVMLKK
jgi:hypothetical protein